MCKKTKCQIVSGTAKNVNVDISQNFLAKILVSNYYSITFTIDGKLYYLESPINCVKENDILSIAYCQSAPSNFIKETIREVVKIKNLSNDTRLHVLASLLTLITTFIYVFGTTNLGLIIAIGNLSKSQLIVGSVVLFLGLAYSLFLIWTIIKTYIESKDLLEETSELPTSQ